MKIKLKTDAPADIPVSEMKDGELAVITKWNAKQYIGTVVVRVGKNLLELGGSLENGNAWHSGIFTSDLPHLRVRLLKKGDILEIGE